MRAINDRLDHISFKHPLESTNVTNWLSGLERFVLLTRVLHDWPAWSNQTQVYCWLIAFPFPVRKDSAFYNCR